MGGKEDEGEGENVEGGEEGMEEGVEENAALPPAPRTPSPGR